MTTEEPENEDDAYLSSELQWLRCKFEHWYAANEVHNDSPPLEVAAAELAAALDQRAAAAASALFPALTIVSENFQLSEFERDLLLLCVAMELDPLTAQRCRPLNVDGAPYPTFGLALRLFEGGTWDALSPWRPLRAARLISVAAAPGQPLVAMPLLAEEAIVHYVKGLLRVKSYPQGDVHSHLDQRLAAVAVPTSPADIPVPPSQVDLIVTLLACCADTADEPAVLNLVGPSPADSRQVAAATARAAEYDLFRVDGADLLHRDVDDLAALWRRDRHLHRVGLLVETHDLRPDVDTAVARFLNGAGGLRFLASREPVALGTIPHTVVDVGWVPPSEQQLLWLEALRADQAPLAAELAHRFRLDAETIMRVGRAARADVGDGTAGQDPTARDANGGEPGRLFRRCRNATRPDLAGLAVWTEPSVGWRDLVVPAPTAAELRDIAVHVRHRLTVLHDWGFSAQTERGLGISVLFSGPSGTGKTRAAEVLAHELDVPLCRVDLSAVVSKYIGETEKNLSRVFSAAEASNALLLFDEADALFGRRSEVRDSHDRYANTEVSYLLQRLESFNGLAVLSTNMADAIDTAFVRRLRFAVLFEFPGAPERRQIWATVFPPGVPVDNLDPDALARIPVTGATIRNIALHAAFAAAAAGQPVSEGMIITAAHREMARTGQRIPDGLARAARVST